ncbi:MAG: DoxX family protein [Colwellia sp.]|uniref:DoxX family protein n=1 Tax=Colwellia sp. TaxID=56799 RepID=UPI0025B905B9|nr:DoxX family protein [Colwellia sp.]NQZ28302.1 DoxX family protein [Colwellia sp.]
MLTLTLRLATFFELAEKPELHQIFQVIRLPDWFGYFIGLVELLAGIGLLISRFSVLAGISPCLVLFIAQSFNVVYVRFL